MPDYFLGKYTIFFKHKKFISIHLWFNTIAPAHIKLLEGYLQSLLNDIFTLAKSINKFSNWDT